MFSWLASSLEVRKDKEDEYLTFDCLRDPEELAKQQELLYVAVTYLFSLFVYYRFRSKLGKGVFGMTSSCMTFVPLAAISPEEESLHKNLKESIRAGIAANECPPALQKQLQIQLDRIRDKEPSCELVLAPGFTSQPSEYRLTICNFHDAHLMSLVLRTSGT